MTREMSKSKKVSREKRLQWLGHVTRMDEVRIPKQELQWEVTGFKRRPGRPRIHWRDIMNKDLQRMELTCREEVEASAQDRHTSSSSSSSYDNLYSAPITKCT